jgi:hypothetical protein
MKSFVWWAGVTTLNADANIWELNEWTYVTTYDLFYKTWEKIPRYSWTWNGWKNMIFVIKESGWQIWYFAFWETYTNNAKTGKASFWYSNSSSDWECKELWDRAWALNQFAPVQSQYAIDGITSDILTQVVTDVYDTNNIALWQNPYPWVTYTIYVESVKSGETYTVGLGTWVTNPFWITLPTSSNKKCIITVLPTSTTTAIITWCIIES